MPDNGYDDIRERGDRHDEEKTKGTRVCVGGFTDYIAISA